jgi:N2-acetyl-L-2,4-diaminobutanoate deacetylase
MRLSDRVPPNWQPGWQLWQATPEAAVHVFTVGNEADGPTALIAAGVHGDEYEGPAAVAILAHKLKDETLLGRVLLVPVMNPLARLSGTRLTEQDGKNLARSFPGRLEGSETERLAAALFEHLVMPASFVIDLHSGGVEYLFLPVAGFYGKIDPDNASYRAARRFGLPSIWQLPPTAGVMSYEAMQKGKVAIGHEYLGAGQLSREGTTAYVEGVMNCLREWSILRRDEPARLPEQQCFVGDWQLSSTTGLFVSKAAMGSRVERGATIAEIHNERGEVVEAFHAPFTAEVLGLRSKAHIQQGAWAVLLGVRTDLV